jgi:AcrR family transcriptional regulator
VESERNTELLLDAALQSVLAVGVRRTTMTDVARRAGVSRMTLYRSFPDIATVLKALMTREFEAFISAVSEDVASIPTARGRLVESAVACVERLPEHPLFQRVLDVDPELIVPYVIDRLGTTQRFAVGVFGMLLAEGRADGSIDVGDRDVAAYCLQLALQSFVFSARITDKEHPRSLVSNELRKLLNGYLAPVTGAGDGAVDRRLDVVIG